MLIRIQATKFLFWSFRNNQLPTSHWTLPRASIIHRTTPTWTQVNLQSYPRANPAFWRHHSPESPAVQYPWHHFEALSNNRRVLRLQSRRLFSPTLKTCKTHALMVDSYEIPCNLDHHTINHVCYNKFAHEDRAATQFSRIPHPSQGL